MSNGKNNKRNITLIITIILVVLVVIGIILITKSKNNNKLEDNVNNTMISKSKSYKMDLRIYGTYKNKNINDIIMVGNYKDTDKEISITSGEKEEMYLVKDKEKYSVKDEKLTKVDKVPYENTEVYLSAVKKIKDVKQLEDQMIGKTMYKVYEGVISKDDMKGIIKESNLDVKLDEDVKTEVWLTKDNYVYKIYYKIGDLTIYPSYFGYGNMNKVNLDMYK